MDMPPSIEYQMPAKNNDDIELDNFDLYKYYVLDRINGPDIPDSVKQFAKDNNCILVMKKYFWSSKLFNDKGGVHSCLINKKEQFIFEYNNKLRFAHWWEKIRIQRTIVYEN